MAWVKDSDDVCHDVALRRAGAEAALLWFVVVREAAAANGGAGTNGVLDPLLLTDAGHLFTLKTAPATKALLESGHLHDQQALDDCIPCRDDERTRPLGDGELFIHEWWEHLLDADGKKDPRKRSKEARRKALNRDLELVGRIRERDRDLCRYCGRLTLDNSGPDKKSARIRQLDHIDPFGPNTYENVVVSCRECNQRKGDRTPTQANMPLLDPGTERTRRTAGSAARSVPENPAESGTPIGDIEDGSPRSGRAGSAPDRIGPDRDPTAGKPGTDPGQERP